MTGRGERGIIKKMDEVEIVGLRDIQKTVATDLEMFRKLLDEARAGENVGVLLRGIKKDQVERGQVLSKPGTIQPHTKFKGEVYVLTKEEGGRHTPFFTNYRPQFYFRTTDVTGALTLEDNVEMVMPGDRVTVSVELGKEVAMEQGLTFAIREGGRTIGSGRVAEVVECFRVRGRGVVPRTGMDWTLNRAVVQLVEQGSPKPSVGGSNPSRPANQF